MDGSKGTWDRYIVLLKIIRPYRWPVFGLLGVSFISALLEGIGVGLLVPLLQGLEGAKLLQTGNRIVDFLGQPFLHVSPEQRLKVVIISLFLVVLLKNGFNYAQYIIDEWFRVQVMRDLRMRVYDQLFRVGYRFIIQQRAGDLLSSFNNDVPRTGTAARALLMQVPVACMTAVYIVFLLMISWPLTLLAVGMLGFISWPLQRLLRKSQYLGEVLTGAQANLSTINLETISGMRLVRIFGREQYEKQRYYDAALSVDRLYMRMARFYNLVKPISEVLAFGVLAVLIVVGAELFIKQNAVMPLVITFLFVLFRLLPQATQFNSNRAEISKHFGAIDAVTQMLSTADKPYVNSGSVPFSRLRHGIVFERVAFSYKVEEGLVVKDLSIEIPAGRITALVGASGAGKSTIADLVPRFYDPDVGRILVDGIDLRELDLKRWRAAIGIVSQDPFIFGGTIRENIAYGKLDASQEEIEESARLANAYEFITRLSMGFETALGDRGVRLSGGQKQRIAIARAILRNPQLLILDEATSALDSVSERLIQTAIEELSANRTVLVVAHRLSTIINAHQVIVVENGCAVERGTHQELLQRQGVYWNYHALQFKPNIG